jgi:hypothetical protein
MHRYLRALGLQESLQRTPTASEIESAAPESAKYCRLSSFLSPTKKLVYCGIATPFSARLYAELRKRQELFFLPEEKVALEYGAIPGPSTFFSPYFPSYVLRVLGNASGVITFYPEVAYLAQRHGIPCVYLGKETNLPAEIHTLQYKKSVSAFAEEIVNTLNIVKVRMEERHFPTVSNPVPVASISDIYYLPFLLGFIENAWERSEGNISFHVLALDDEVGKFLAVHYPQLSIKVYTLKDIWAPTELPVILSRPVGYRAFSSKPKFLEKVLLQEKMPDVYCDSDVFFFESPRRLAQELGNKAALLFPHWNDEDARLDGLFNAGMVVVGPGAEKFLSWWSTNTLQKCDPKTVGDQGYLDEAVVQFGEIGVYRERDHDVARWNLRTLGVKWDPSLPERPVLADGRPVSTFHTAFIDSLGFFEAKWCWDSLVTFFSPYSKVAQASSFLSTVLHQQRVHWLSLSRSLKFQETVLARWFGVTPHWRFQICWSRGLLKNTLSFFLSFKSLFRRLFLSRSKTA